MLEGLVAMSTCEEHTCMLLICQVPLKQQCVLQSHLMSTGNAHCTDGGAHARALMPTHLGVLRPGDLLLGSMLLGNC